MVVLVVRMAMTAIYRFFQENLSPSSPSDSQPRQAGNVQTGGELRKDPVCGTFVPTATAVTKNVNGQLLHFCSAACRDKYRVA
jgi:YHS domain-containing protein